MKKIVIPSMLAALSLVSPSFAGGIRLTVTAGGTAQYNLTSTVPDADLGRLVAYAKSVYGQVVQTPAVTNPDGSVTPAVMRDRTNAEAIDAWWRGVLAGTKANVENFEKVLGVQAVTVAPVTVGPPQ